MTSRPSQCDLIASVLADRSWHTAAEIHERCGFSRLNSRIAELRSRRRLHIECRHVPGRPSGADAYEYRLADGPLESAPVPAAGADSSGVRLSIAPGEQPDAAPIPGQLTIDEVAA